MDDTVELCLGDLVTAAGSVGLERETEQLLADTGPLTFRIAYAVLRHREDAEDVAQEALARAHRDLHKLRDRERFRAWLVRICWRMALAHRRSRLRRERREQATPAPHTPSTEEVAAANEFRTRLWNAIDDLPEKLRMVIVLAGIQGYAVHDIASLLNLPEGTVKSRLYLARKRLAEKLR